jgi:hypothetical protein
MSTNGGHRLAIALLALAPAACRASSTAPPRTAPLTAVAAAPRHEESEYALPAGLKWGLSPEEAKKVLLASGFSFKGEEKQAQGHGKQTYQGALAGLAVDSLTAGFRDGGLNSVVLVLPALDSPPATQRWQALVDAMKQSGGDPTRLSPLQKAGRPVGPVGYEALDQNIKNGVPGPQATWLAKNTMVTISVNATDLDGKGKRVLHPAWAYFGPGSLYEQHQVQDAEIEGAEEE